MTRNHMAERGYRVSKPALRRKMFLCGAAAGSAISLLSAPGKGSCFTIYLPQYTLDS